MRNLDDFAVCQDKSGNIDGVHEGVFADRSVRQAITVATRIGALGENADDLRPETFLCRGLQFVRKPRVDRCDHRTVEGGRGINSDFAFTETSEDARRRCPAYAFPRRLKVVGDERYLVEKLLALRARGRDLAIGPRRRRLGRWR